jgi:hypothetical protein
MENVTIRGESVVLTRKFLKNMREKTWVSENYRIFVAELEYK